MEIREEEATPRGRRMKITCRAHQPRTVPLRAVAVGETFRTPDLGVCVRLHDPWGAKGGNLAAIASLANSRYYDRGLDTEVILIDVDVTWSDA